MRKRRSVRVRMTAETKVLYKDEGRTRVLRGTLTGEDETFVFLQRSGSTFRISKEAIILIETPNERSDEP